MTVIFASRGNKFEVRVLASNNVSDYTRVLRGTVSRGVSVKAAARTAAVEAAAQVGYTGAPVEVSARRLL